MRINKIKNQNSKLSLAKIRIISRLKGDGSIFRTGRRKTNYFIKLETVNYNEIKSFANDIKEVYGLKPKYDMHRSGKNPNKKLPVVYVRSKNAYEDLMKYGPYYSNDWIVPRAILTGNNRGKIEFINVFAEDEGTIVQNEVRIYSTNIKGLTQLSNMLKQLRVINKIRSGYGANRNVYGICITKKKDLNTFKENIGFRSEEKNNKLRLLIKRRMGNTKRKNL